MSNRGRLKIFLTGVLMGGGFLFFCVGQVSAASQDIQITEIMYDPSGSDTNHEWVELKNTGTEAVEVAGSSGAAGWRFFDGSNHTLSTSMILLSGEYLIVTPTTTIFLEDHPGFGGKMVKSSFSLVNTSSTLALRIGSDGEKWSEVTYESNWGGNGNGKSLEKKNLIGDNSVSNWQESATEGGTPGVDNSAGSAPPTPLENPPPAPAGSSSGSGSGESLSAPSCVNTVLINELMINPEDSNADYEFIEIYNPLGQEVGLSGWTLEDTQGKAAKYLFPPEAKILALGHLALFRPQTKITLNNSGDGVKLIGVNGEICDSSPTNSGPSKDDWSYGRGEDSRWAWSTVATPGIKNVFSLPDTAVSEKLELSPKETEAMADSQSDFKGLVALNEFLPNPKGADKEEFIELKNNSKQELNLGKWWLEDLSRQKHIFSSSTILAKEGFLVLWKQKTGLSLNNNGDTVKLFAQNRQLVDEVKYEETAEEDFSYSRVFATGTVWQWSKVATPGVVNVIQSPNLPPVIIFALPNAAEAGEEIVFDASDTADPEGDELSFFWDFGDGGQSVQEMATHTFQKAGRRKIVLKVNDHQGNEAMEKTYFTVMSAATEENVLMEDAAGKDEKASVKKSKSGSAAKFLDGTLSQARDLEVGDQARFTGLVTVSPGVFGSQIFYLREPAGPIGMQIYMFKKDFPDLKIGDKVEVTGEIGLSQGENRLKIKKKADIKVLGAAAVEPSELTTADLVDEYSSGLVTIEGEVMEPASSQFYVADESGEIMVQFKSGTKIKGKIVKEGDQVKVTGILGQSKGIFRIWPRVLDDIKIIQSAENLDSTAGAAGNDEKKTAEKYLTATAGGLGALLLAFLARSRGVLAKTAVVGCLKKVGSWRRGKIDKG